VAVPEIERLTVVWDARFDRMEEKLNKVIRSNYAAADKVSKGWDKANDNVAKSFARGGLTQGLEALSSRAPAAASGLSGLGLAGLAASAGLGALAIASGKAFEAMDFGDQLQASADKIGITAEALQELRFAADETDVPVEALESSLQRLNGTLGAFKTGVGDGKVKEAFEALGIKPQDLKGINNANDLLPILADRLGRVSDTAAQVQLARKLGGEDILPILRLQADGLDLVRRRAHELGLVLSNETVKALSDADRQMELAGQQINANLRAAFAGLATDIATATTALLNFFTELKTTQPALAVFLKSLSQFPSRGFVGAARSAFEEGRRADARRLGAPETPSSADMRSFFAKPRVPSPDFIPAGGGGGGGGGAAAKRAAEADRAARDAEQRRERERRIANDIYRAELALLDAHNSDRRATEDRLVFTLDRLQLERRHRAIELDQLEAEFARSRGLQGISAAERQTLEAKEDEARRAEEMAAKERAALELIDQRLRQEETLAGFELEILGIQEGLARTQSDRRAIQLEMLETERRIARKLLEEELSRDANLTPGQREDRLKGFDAATGARRQGVIANTRPPLEDYFASLPRDAKEANERMQELASEGIASVVDGLAQAAAGMTSLKDVAIGVVQQMTYEFTKLNIERLLGNLSGKFSLGGEDVAGAVGAQAEAASTAAAAASVAPTIGAAITTAGTAAGTAMGTAITAGGTTSATQLATAVSTSGATAAASMATAITTAGATAAAAMAAAISTANTTSNISSLPFSFGGGGGGGGDLFAGLYATGGQVRGPGTGTSDSIPAYVSNGEFIINAEATRKNLTLLTAINDGHPPPRFADGGLVRATPSASPALPPPTFLSAPASAPAKAPIVTVSVSPPVGGYSAGGARAAQPIVLRTPIFSAPVVNVHPQPLPTAPRNQAALPKPTWGERPWPRVILARAEGGPVIGPGTGTSDSIPAYVSNGEFIVKAKAAAKHPELLQAINTGRIPRFAEGGLVNTGALMQQIVRQPAMAQAPGPGIAWNGDVVVNPHPGMSLADNRRTGSQVAAAAMRKMAAAKKQGF
jgi:hypothetical protein